jgi:bifunctional non-homologous end joining protein LigD
VKWEEVENCLKKGDPTLLVFDSNQVLARVDKFGDLFEGVLKLKQKMPAVEGLAGNNGGGSSTKAATKAVPATTAPAKTTAVAKAAAPAAKKKTAAKRTAATKKKVAKSK